MTGSGSVLRHLGKLSSDKQMKAGLMSTMGQSVSGWGPNAPLEREPETQEKSLEEEHGIR